MFAHGRLMAYDDLKQEKGRGSIASRKNSMIRLGEDQAGEAFPRLSDVDESREEILHNTQINLAPEAFERFSDVFEGAVRRWERVIYPAMFVLVLVMSYGFFLMFSLANDMKTIASKFDPNMGHHMATLSVNMEKLTASILEMHKDMRTIARVMPEMNAKLDAMKEIPAIRVEMAAMNRHMSVMNSHMDVMNRQMTAMNSRMFVMTGNISDMNRNVSRPMSFMNSFMPW